MLFIFLLFLAFSRSASTSDDIENDRFTTRVEVQPDKCQYQRPDVLALTKDQFTHREYLDKGFKGGKQRLVPPVVCTVISVSLKANALGELHTTLSHVFSFIADMDEGSTFKHIEISYTSTLSSGAASYNQTTATAVDSFVQKRPWWVVKEEPFDHKEINIISLIRYPRWEKYLRFITSIQYPADCTKQKLLVSPLICIHPGWMSVLKNTNPIREHRKMTTFNQYVSTAHLQKNAFIDANDCHNTKNIWECAFIPMTNCSMPSVLADCITTDCEKSNMAHASSGFSVAGLNGELEVVNATGSWQEVDDEMIDFYYRPPPDTKIRTKILNEQPMLWLMSLMLIVRRNAFYRSRVAAILSKMNEKVLRETGTVFGDDSTCVAAHLRRGDRNMYIGGKPVNMSEYCHNFTHGGDCLTEGPEGQPRLVPCPHQDTINDFGCRPGHVPLGSVTLAEVIDRAVSLVGPGTRNLFVMTDDLHWLASEIETASLTHPEWTIVTPDFPLNLNVTYKRHKHKHKNKHSNTTTSERETEAGGAGGAESRMLFGSMKNNDEVRFKGGTAAGSFMWAQVARAAKCDGFVSHFSSAFSSLIYTMMCLDKYGLCPPAYDFAKEKSKRVGVNEDEMRQEEKQEEAVTKMIEERKKRLRQEMEFKKQMKNKIVVVSKNNNNNKNNKNNKNDH